MFSYPVGSVKMSAYIKPRNYTAGIQDFLVYMMTLFCGKWAKKKRFCSKLLSLVCCRVRYTLVWAEQPSAEVFLLSFHFFLLSMFIKIQASLLLPPPNMESSRGGQFFSLSQ